MGWFAVGARGRGCGTVSPLWTIERVPASMAPGWRRVASEGGPASRSGDRAAHAARESSTRSAVSDRGCAQGIATGVGAGSWAGASVGADGSLGGGSTRWETSRAVGVRAGGPARAGG